MYIFASANYSFLSSTGVKEIATFGGDVGDLVPGSGCKGACGTTRSLMPSCVAAGQELAIRRRKATRDRSDGPMRKL